MANRTVQEIFDRAQDYIKIDSSTIGEAGLESSRAINWINDLNSMFFGEYYGRGLQAPAYMKTETGYNSVAATDLDGAVLQGATTLDVTSATDLDASGAILVRSGAQFDVVEYTGKSSNQLTGVTGVNYDHSDAEAVYKLYALPSNFGRLRKGRRVGDGITVEGTPYFQVPHLPMGREFTIIEGTTNYLWIETAGDVHVSYDKAPTALTAVTDTVDVPQHYDYYIMWGLVKMFKEIEDQDYRGDAEDVRMQRLVQEAISKDAATKKVRAGVKYFGSRRRTPTYYYV